MHLRFCISQWPFFIALWAFIFLIVGEILIRSISPQYSTESLLVEDENLGWKINIELNPSSQGFLEEEINLIKHRDKKLMYAVGDSYAYGIVPYEDNYLTIVDSNFIAIDIINLGVPMYGPQQYFHIIQKFTDKQTPDYVLLNLFVGNDYEDKNNKREFIVGTPLSTKETVYLLSFYSRPLRTLSTLSVKGGFRCYEYGVYIGYK
jgi:hypothetical protein